MPETISDECCCKLGNPTRIQRVGSSMDDTEKPTVLLVDWMDTTDYNVVNAFREYAINNYMTVIYAKQLPHDGREHINSPLWEITK